MKTDFFGINVDLVSKEDVIIDVKQRFSNEIKTILLFLNAHCYNISRKNIEYKNVLNSADLLLNDGIGIELGGRLGGIKFKDNLNGTDLIPQILNELSNDGKIFLLGGKDDVAEKAMNELVGAKLNVVGFHNGFFHDDKKILNKIINCNANILVLGMGVPKQEIWLNENIESLSNIKLAIAGGAILDFISKSIPRAPKWMRDIRLEWFYRLMLEPKRMWQRYLIGNVKFVYYIMKSKV